jgi:hypothetical protein
LPRWVAWRNERRGKKITKVPYDPRASGTMKAKADDPDTWGTRAEAEAAAARLINGIGGGIGIELGDLGNGRSIGGIDVDTCRDSQTGVIEPWASNVLQRFGYAEVSRFGTGVKAFFTYPSAELQMLRTAMRKRDGEGSGRKWARGKGDHVPSIELYLDGRYFTVTEQRLPETPAELQFVPTDTLLWLIREAGPAFGGGTRKSSASSTDSSRSAAAFRKGAALRRQGRSFEEMAAALRDDPETTEWCREKGDANDGRELRRIWEKAAPQGWLDRCQRNADGKPRCNLANALLAMREAPDLREKFAYDEMLRAPILKKPLELEPDTPTFEPRPVRDVDVTVIQEALQLAGLPALSKDIVHQAVDLRAVELIRFATISTPCNGTVRHASDGGCTPISAPNLETMRAASGRCS